MVPGPRTLRQGRWFPHFRAALFHVWTTLSWRRVAWHLWVGMLLLCNLWFAYVAHEFLDLYISSVELWAELARKHLEIVLS